METTNDILFQEFVDADKRKCAQIILNRPKTLNALTGEMFQSLRAHLEKWQADDSVKAVILKSASEKAFCAGGDIRAIYENRDRPPAQLAQYFVREYGVNHIIYHYPKPLLAFLDGITMGGGVGLSTHSTYAIATENLRWAMPETLIGFFPDVGATYHLSRLPKHIGTYLALTGQSIDVCDAVTLDLAHYFVPAQKLDALEKAIIETPFGAEDQKQVSKIISTFSEKVKPGELHAHVKAIKACFCFDTVEKIIDALHASEDAWCRETASQLLARSPTSLKVTLEQLRRAKKSAFDDVIAMDLQIATQMLAGHDFYEGIRAALIDKDRSPKWQPAQLSGVSKNDVDVYFNVMSAHTR